jgi:zinc transporter ZupT
MARRRNARDLRERIFLFFSVVMGALFAFYGSVLGSWYYASFKSDSWFLPVIAVTIIVVSGILIYMVYHILQWIGQLQQLEATNR